jgi:putative ABC transport system permease protein
MAWLLATIGVYGVTSYGVAQRTREIGIRLALGASPSNILSMVIRETLGIGALAVVSGVAGALAVSRAMISMLYGVAPTDVSALATAVAALLVTVLVAALVPARRAARVEPVIALKGD